MELDMMLDDMFGPGHWDRRGSGEQRVTSDDTDSVDEEDMHAVEMSLMADNVPPPMADILPPRFATKFAPYT